jgi:hypothetical protein
MALPFSAAAFKIVPDATTRHFGCHLSLGMFKPVAALNSTSSLLQATWSLGHG